MNIHGKAFTVREWQPGDAESIARHANNRNVSINLRDRFPYPYSLADAEAFLSRALERDSMTTFAIEVDGEAAGGIAFMLGTDIERFSAEVGYWLSESHWGKGILSELLPLACEQAFQLYSLNRIFALPYEKNVASCRVLEKAGFTLEGTLRKSAVKEGEVLDQRMYALVVS